MDNNFGRILKTLRQKRGLTQSQLGERLNLSRNQIANYETVGFEPSLETVKQIATFFNVSTDLLLSHNVKTDDDLLKQTLLEVQNVYSSLGEGEKKAFAKQIKTMSRFLGENKELL